MRVWCVVLLAGCPAVDDPILECAERTGGAFVTIAVIDDSFTAWSTDDVFIDAALAHVEDGTAQVPNFLEVVAGSDCADPAWSWHVDPEAMGWADFTTEVCDATPRHIEENREEWIAQVGNWCPWSAVPVAVVDRR